MDSILASTFSKDHLQSLTLVLATLIGAIVIDTVLRSFIKVPKKLDNRRIRTYISTIRNLITVVVYITALYIIFVLLNINILPLIASVSIIGVVLGYGAGSLIKDFITGFFLISQESVVTGDYIKIDLAEGYVEAIKFRTIMLRSLGGELYIIPNSLVGTIINYSTRKTNLLLDFAIKPNQEIDTIIKAMNNALSLLQKDKQYEGQILPGSTVNGIEEVNKGMSIMVMRATVITYPKQRLNIARAYRYYVKKEFEKYKIEFS